MLSSYKEMIDEIKKYNKVTISVAAAQDEEVLICIKSLAEEDIADFILVGDEPEIKVILAKIGFVKSIKIINEKDTQKAAHIAVSLVHNNEAQILLKGLLNTSEYMMAILNPEVGLRCGKQLLSHLAVYEIPGSSKLLFMTDSGINIAPNIEEKEKIIDNALNAMKVIGIDKPNIAILAANENVNPKMPVTVEAQSLVQKYSKSKNFAGIIEGPVSLDVAVSAKAAKHKGIDSKAAGNFDLFVFPTIEAGNIWSKSMIHFANFNIAGVILGATNPIVLVSRNETAKAKFDSVTFACLIAAKNKYFDEQKLNV